MAERSLPMFPDEGDDTVYGYMCKVDFECELGGAEGGNRIFADPEDCRRCRPCVSQCGMVKVAIRAIEIVQPENYGECTSESGRT